jgi:hypothetical protein
MPKFAKGQSGNPKGRPPSHRKVAQLRGLIGQYAEPLVKRLIKLAVEESDTAAAKLLIERCIPAVKPIEMTITLPLAPDASMADQGRAVVAALAAGKIPPTQAGLILSGLGSLAKLVELDELDRRLTALEERQP